MSDFTDADVLEETSTFTYEQTPSGRWVARRVARSFQRPREEAAPSSQRDARR